PCRQPVRGHQLGPPAAWRVCLFEFREATRCQCSGLCNSPHAILGGPRARRFLCRRELLTSLTSLQAHVPDLAGPGFLLQASLRTAVTASFARFPDSPLGVLRRIFGRFPSWGAIYSPRRAWTRSGYFSSVSPTCVRSRWTRVDVLFAPSSCPKLAR